MSIKPEANPATKLTPANSQAFWQEKCPRCRTGAVFSGLVTMNPRCPHCGLLFAREPGYFLGAMYFGYALGVPILGLLLFAAYAFWPDWSLDHLLLVALIGFIPFLPMIFRYSRLLWIYFDQTFDPSQSSPRANG